MLLIFFVVAGALFLLSLALLLLQVLLLVLLFVLLLVLSKCYWLDTVAVADAVASTVTVLFWLCYCSGVDASAGPVAGAVEALNIAGAVAEIAVALLALFLVLHVLF